MEQSQKNLGFLLNKVSHLIKWKLNDELKGYGLTSAQWAVLADVYVQRIINEEENKTTPALIADRLNVERPAITRIIDKMITEGWVKRYHNPEDRRSQLIELTEKSMDIMTDLQRISNKVIEETFTGFKEEEINLLRTLLLRIINNF